MATKILKKRTVRVKEILKKSGKTRKEYWISDENAKKLRDLAHARFITTGQMVNLMIEEYPPVAPKARKA